MKIRKILISALSALTVMLGAITPATSVMAADSQFIELDDIEATINQLADGVTVVLTKTADGTFEQNIYYDTFSIPRPRATADGVLEWAEFHLGFNDWNDDTGRLYFTISADEPMYGVSGSAYVKSTSVLHPATFYSDTFDKYLNGSMNTSRTLYEDLYTEDEEKVRVGFSGVVLVTLAGDKGNFSNASQIVNR